ncbi:MAG: hypothetical protein KDC44_18480 [Phaeodactylibacter sp.]|nr:hypothetical protein [Phaeodactylibacter sp.]
MAVPEKVSDLPQNGREEAVEPTASLDSIDAIAPYLYSFEWLSDENLLRDEGCRFGLTTDNPKEKIETIHSFYEEYIARAQRALEIYEERLFEFNNQEDRLEQQAASIQLELEAAATTYSLEKNFYWRSLAGLIGYGVLVLFNFPLILELTPDDWQMPGLIAAGAYTFGLFSVYQRKNRVYPLLDGEQLPIKERWKVYVEEFGIPLMVTLFVFFSGFQSKNILLLTGGCLLLLFLFVFSGKGFFMTIGHISEEYKVWKENRLRNKFRRAKQKKLEDKLLKLEVRGEEIESERKDLAAQQLKRHLELEQLKQKKETVTAYFMSEFKLAQGTRHHFHQE